jgi:enamine deaminase RidA (YjgF/YER057c/UK114 family)
MYDATLLKIVPHYGFGRMGLTHTVVTEGGKTLKMSGYPAISDNGVVGKGDMGLQTTQALELVKLTVERAGGTWDDIIHITFYYTDLEQYHKKGNPARREFFEKHSKTGVPPACTSVGVQNLFHPDFMIEIEATAVFD